MIQHNTCLDLLAYSQPPPRTNEAEVGMMNRAITEGQREFSTTRPRLRREPRIEHNPIIGKPGSYIRD